MIYLTITDNNADTLIEPIKVLKPVMIGRNLFRVGNDKIKASSPAEAVNIFMIKKVNLYASL